MKEKNKLAFVKETLFYVLGIVLIAGFIFMYWTRFILKQAIPPMIRTLYFHFGKEWAIAANAGVFILFLLLLPYRGKVEWRSKGTFSAFILALMAEMFGIPLLLYILSPLFYSHLISVLDFLPILSNPCFFEWPGAVAGTFMTLVGMTFVYVGWVQIHSAKGLVTTGLYKYMRHPQYTGMFLIITGWILHWATVLTMLMYPILLFMYYRLARKEEAELTQEFGAEYQSYYKRTPMFLPIKTKTI